MSVESRVRELGLAVPPPPAPVGQYLPARRVGNLLFASGQTPTIGGRLSVKGRLGAELSVEQGVAAARLAALNCLAEIRGDLGSLDRVLDVVKLAGYVACDPGFLEHPAVVNGASDLLVEVFGDKGRHARAAIGVAALPGGAPVEVELVVRVRRRP